MLIALVMKNAPNFITVKCVTFIFMGYLALGAKSAVSAVSGRLAQCIVFANGIDQARAPLKGVSVPQFNGDLSNLVEISNFVPTQRVAKGVNVLRALGYSPFYYTSTTPITPRQYFTLVVNRRLIPVNPGNAQTVNDLLGLLNTIKFVKHAGEDEASTAMDLVARVYIDTERRVLDLASLRNIDNPNWSEAHREEFKEALLTGFYEAVRSGFLRSYQEPTQIQESLAMGRDFYSEDFSSVYPGFKKRWDLSTGLILLSGIMAQGPADLDGLGAWILGFGALSLAARVNNVVQGWRHGEYIAISSPNGITPHFLSNILMSVLEIRLRGYYRPLF